MGTPGKQTGEIKKQNTPLVLKIMADQWSLTIVTGFVTAKKLH